MVLAAVIERSREPPLPARRRTDQLLTSTPGPVRPLASPEHEIQLPALDCLLEDPEARLLTHVQHFVQRFVSLPHLDGGSLVVVAESLESLAKDRLVRRRRREWAGQPPQVLQDLIPLALIPARPALPPSPRRYC